MKTGMIQFHKSTCEVHCVPAHVEIRMLSGGICFDGCGCQFREIVNRDSRGLGGEVYCNLFKQLLEDIDGNKAKCCQPCLVACEVPHA